MTEKVLPYDRAIVPQETGHWCGPASIQIVLNSRGVRMNEADIARETERLEGNVNFDDEDGTDNIRQITDVLNVHTAGKFVTRQMPHDPPTPAETGALWAAVRTSIDAGYPVVVNIVAPPSNYPRGVKGSVSPSYGGGTVFHYLSVAGYDDAYVPANRNDPWGAVWMADSGFRPFGYWMSFAQLASLIPPKGYSFATVAPGSVPAPPPAVVPSDGLTAERLSQAMGGALPLARYHALLPAFCDAMKVAKCTTPLRAAMWCAQLGHESAGLGAMEEFADGSQYEGRDDLGNIKPGDGRRFKGRGPIQITGRHNYTELSKWAHGKGLVPTPTYFVDRPADLASDKFGFVGAVWYWTVARPGINAMCDRSDLEGVTRAINGGLNGIDDRRARWNRCRAMGAAILPIEGDIDMATVNDINRKLDLILDQLGPRRSEWGEGSSAGRDERGQELTLRDGLTKGLRDIAAIAKAVVK